jgi:hypothetical protein
MAAGISHTNFATAVPRTALPASVNGPPIARLVVRVGVTGHRSKGLVHAHESVLRAAVRDVFESVLSVCEGILANGDSGYAAEPPTVRIISPLAEGADRIVAEEGLALGLELNAPLPFERAEYEQDFKSPNSRKDFHELLSQATAVLELDGHREHQRQAYEAVGRTVLRQCDVLIAIWNGEHAAGVGGTGQMVQEANQLQIPTVWIHSHPPHAAQFLSFEGDRPVESDLQEFSHRLANLLRAPSTCKHDGKGRSTYNFGTEFLTAAEPGIMGRLLLAIGKTAFDILGGTWPWSGDAAQNHSRKLSDVSSGPWQLVKEQVEARFLSYQGWAGRRARYYANLYRSAFIFSYLLSAAAVCVAVCTYFVSHSRSTGLNVPMMVLTATELLIIMIIVYTIHLGRKGHWHEQWIDYRLLAEQLRHMQFLAPHGRSAPSISIPAYDAEGDPRSRWGHWYFCAVIRQGGMLSARIDQPYLEAFSKRLMENEIRKQVVYHESNARRFHAVEHNLHRFASTFFYSTAVVCLLHLLLDPMLLVRPLEGFLGPKMPIVHGAVVFLSAVLPALGAALYGIRSQGDFANIEKRSLAMSEWLKDMAARLETLPTPLSSTLLGNAAEEAAVTMLSELLNWCVIFQGKPLGLP